MIGQIPNTENWEAKNDNKLHERAGKRLKRNWLLKVKVSEDKQARRKESLNL